MTTEAQAQYFLVMFTDETKEPILKKATSEDALKETLKDKSGFTITMIPRITKSDLVYYVNKTGSHYFERSTLRFFGESISGYSVSSVPVLITDRNKVVRCAYAMKRGKTRSKGLNPFIYFDALTFKTIMVD